MFFEEPDQNPEKVGKTSTREEKPDTVNKAVEKLDNMEKAEKSTVNQIHENEKQQIVDLLHDEKTTKTVEIKAEKTAAVQVAEIEPVEPIAEVKDVVADAEVKVSEKKANVAEVETEVSKVLVETKAERVVAAPQIDKKEKEAVIQLLKDLPSKIVDEPEEPAGPVLQISKKERRMIIGFLRGRKPAETSEHQEELDYDGMNKLELVEMFEEIVEERDIAKIKVRVGKINKAFHKKNKEEKDSALAEFIEAGGVKEEYQHTDDPLELRFKSAFNQYKHNKGRYAQELEKIKAENLQLKIDTLEELKELIGSEETLKKTYDEFKRLQDRWKQIGLVPAGELNNLWQNYHFLVEKFFDKVRINKELRDLDLKKNMELKLELCEKTEELFLEKSIIKSFKLLQKYHDEWREIGPVPMDKKEELWERFKTATDKINVRRKEHYKELQEEQQANYEGKKALCEKAEEIFAFQEGTLKEWNKRTDEMNELFKIWKSLGRASKDQNDEVWVRFKTAMDGFYNNKREFLGKLKDQQMNNLNLKIDLCAQAEAIMESEDWRNTTNELIKLQNEWKGIGPVPRRHSDKVWKRFRSACDGFFKRKSDFFKNIHGVEADNLKLKKDVIKEITSFKVTKKKENDMAALQGFQRRWIEIGHVPFKEKDKVQLQYREAIDKLIDTMDINKMDLTQSGYETKIEMLKSDPDSEWRLSKERDGLHTKIKKIREDVLLWENNIGFFSNSKNSEVFKKEFENKIEKAKQEIEALEARMKILN